MPIWEECRDYITTIFAQNVERLLAVDVFSAQCTTTLYGAQNWQPGLPLKVPSFLPACAVL